MPELDVNDVTTLLEQPAQRRLPFASLVATACCCSSAAANCASACARAPH